MKIKLWIILVCVLATACNPAWTLVGSTNSRVQLNDIAFSLPEQWVLYNDHDNSYTSINNGNRTDNSVRRVVLSRNGLNLDYIDIIEFSAVSAFPSIERPARKDLLPSELAELFIAEQKITLGIDQVEVMHSQPVVIEGRDGFMVQLQFKNRAGLELQQKTYGFATTGHYYAFNFRAPSLHYFDNSVSEFERLIASVRLKL